MMKTSNGDFDEMVSDTKIPLRLACVKPNGVPAIVSLWYLNLNGKLYCATQKSAKIVLYLEQNPVCGFEIAGDKPPYKGTRGDGGVRILENKGRDILNLLIEKYLGGKESVLSKFLKKNSDSEVAIEITPTRLYHYDYSKRMEDI